MRRGLFGRLGKLGLNLMIQPNISPIIFLTQWRMMGNSVVHTDEYLTQWKVSGNSQIQQYLTQWKVEGNSQIHLGNLTSWKVEGNSVVDNNAILSCGDLGQDGYYHVKISNGVNVYDIPLTEPLRKVNDVADTIEFANGVAALTRNFASVDLGRFSWTQRTTNTSGIYRYSTTVKVEVLPNCIVPSTKIAIALCPKYSIVNPDYTYGKSEGIGLSDASNLANGQILIYDSNANTLSASDFQNYLQGVELIYQITPTTETIQVPDIAVSPTGTYTSANDIVYSAFIYTEDKQIWSCGDYSDVDNKYHVKISNGVDVFDIALDEPLRKVNDVADKIEFANGTAVVTRNIASTKWNELTVVKDNQVSNYDRFRTDSLSSVILLPDNTADSRLDKCLSSDFVQNNAPINKGTDVDQCMAAYNTGSIYIRDTSVSNPTEFQAKYGTHELLYKLATPTTEVIQAPQISVSPTNTYSSANTTPYSSFTYANPLIYSCGDYSDVDNKYHVKISNGVSIYDIPLIEPLRKVGSVADKIEFADGTAVVTRNIGSNNLGGFSYVKQTTGTENRYRFTTSAISSTSKVVTNNNNVANILSAEFITVSHNNMWNGDNITPVISINVTGTLSLFSPEFNELIATEVATQLDGIEIIYELATPTTETIQVSPFPISPTDTYTSANDTPYSAFEYKKNVEIWSCGEYSEVDGKYHILVQPLGGSIADIALTEPLRKINDVADTIEFPSDTEGKALVTRNNAFIRQSYDSGYYGYFDVTGKVFYTKNIPNMAKMTILDHYAIIICNKLETSFFDRMRNADIVAIGTFSNVVVFRNYEIEQTITAYKAWLTTVGELDLIYQLETPTTELADAPQIEEAESYTCVISQGAKAVSWSDFETE